MVEIRSFLQAILEAEAANAAEIQRLQQTLQEMGRDIKEIEKGQKDLLRSFENHWKVKEQDPPVYRPFS